MFFTRTLKTCLKQKWHQSARFQNNFKCYGWKIKLNGLVDTRLNLWSSKLLNLNCQSPYVPPWRFTNSMVQHCVNVLFLLVLVWIFVKFNSQPVSAFLGLWHATLLTAGYADANQIIESLIQSASVVQRLNKILAPKYEICFYRKSDLSHEHVTGFFPISLILFLSYTWFCFICVPIWQNEAHKSHLDKRCGPLSFHFHVITFEY